MVVALVADAEPLVGAHRDRLDPTTRRGLGAHVTLVYPFVEPARITEDTVRDLRAALAPVAPFACAFPALRWFSDRVLWLAPDPVAPFVEIADRIVHDVPGCPPAQRDLVPHLTVGLRRHASAADLLAAGQELTPALPLITRIEAVQLMVRAATWETVVEVRLGDLSPSGPSGPGSPGSP
jgi:2'-5' RNA ligase